MSATLDKKGFAQFLLAKAHEDSAFRDRLVRSPKTTIEQEFGKRVLDGHEFHVHEESYSKTHLVLPPTSKYSKVEREEAKTGVESLTFLRKTLYDPAPPIRSADDEIPLAHNLDNPEDLVGAGRVAIKRGLGFVESTLDQNGAFHCIRFNVADPNIPRHFERPPFISALCALALGCSEEKQAKTIVLKTESYLAQTIEYPGVWRYYRHLPNDLDSTTLCSLALKSHPWIFLGKNATTLLNNRDAEGRFLTWLEEEDEPVVVEPFRIEADPVVNANVISCLGDIPETKRARTWLISVIEDGSYIGASKWYPDPLSSCYAVSRAVLLSNSAMDAVIPALTERILDQLDENCSFGNCLQSAQAVSALYNIGSLEKINIEQQLTTILEQQRSDGSWPELLAFGDQSLSWGTIGQFGHGSESVTSAFCIEALEKLLTWLTQVDI